MFNILLQEIKEKGIKISFANGKLLYEGPEQFITEEFLSKLKANKGKLIKHFWPLKDSNMMPVNTEGNKIPFILVHGEKANYYINDSLGQDHPFYGYFLPGSDGEPLKDKSVEEYAGDYLEQLQTIIPDGPYIIGGFSFGGIIAYEMAVQLQQKGHEVIRLFLFDCVSTYCKGKIHKKVMLKVKDYLIRLFYVYVMLLAQLNIFLKNPVPLKIRKYYITRKYWLTYLKYEPKKFDGDIVLFKSMENDSNDKNLGWAQTVNGNIEVFNFDGNHLDLINRPENAKRLTAIVHQKVMEAQQDYEKSISN